MTKTTKNASTNAFASISETIEQVQSKMEVPAAARDFVKRTAGTAKERAESLHNGATDVATRAEKFTTAFVGGYANVVRGLIDASLANVCDWPDPSTRSSSSGLTRGSMPER